MRHEITAMGIIAALALSACGEKSEETAHAATCEREGVYALDAWAKPAREGQPVSAAYVTLCNGGEEDTAIVAASYAGAGATEIHQSSMEDGVMSMKKIDALPLPAGEKAEMAPGGYHIMLIGVTETLEPGDVAPVTLTLENGDTLQLDFDVRQPEAPGHAEH